MHVKLIVHANYQEILLKALKIGNGTYTRALARGSGCPGALAVLFLAAPEAEASSVLALLLPILSAFVGKL